MKKGFLRVWNGFTSVLVALVVILAILLAGVRLGGLRVFSVLSGSMEPTYHVGALIYVKDVDPYELKTGDVITYLIADDTVVTHRIAGVVPDEEDPTIIRFRTKGDANEVEDGTLTHYQNVVGTPVFTIPYLGYLAAFIKDPPGTYIAIAAGLVLLVLVFLPDLLSDSEEEQAAPTRKKKRRGRYQGKYLKK